MTAVRRAVHELADGDEIVWRALIPAGGIGLVLLLIIARQAGSWLTLALLFVSVPWLLVGLLTWEGEAGLDEPQEGEAPRVARPLPVPIPLQPAAPAAVDQPPSQAAAG